MGKIIALLVIAAVAWFIYNGTIDTQKVNDGLNKAKDASAEAVQNETTFKKMQANRQTNEEVVNTIK